MHTTPAVSVIIAVYNAAPFLAACVDSLIGQCLDDIEIILVNDGSTDDSPSLCDHYAARDARVRVIHKPNGGVSSARQRGIEAARGEYTIHADPDDWAEPEMLAELYAHAQRTGADMVICDYFLNRPNGQRYCRQAPSALSPQTVLRELYVHLFGSCWNKLVRRSCYAQHCIAFPEEMTCYEDLYVNSCLCAAGVSVAYLPKAFYHYSQGFHPSSLTKTSSIPNVRKLQRRLHYCLPPDVLDHYATPRLAFSHAYFLFFDPTVGNCAYRNAVRPLLRNALRAKGCSSLSKLLFALGYLWLKTPLLRLFTLYSKLR